MSKQAARLLTSCFFCIALIFSSESVYGARSIKIDSFKDLFHNDEEGEVQVSLTGFDAGEEIRLKGAFAGDDSTNYFGFTNISGEWIKNSIKTEDQPNVIINSWDKKLKVKPDLIDTGFHGSADYNFKIGFYYVAASGNLSSVNWSDSVKVHIDFVPSPTTIPTVLPTSTIVLQPTAIPTSAPKITTKTNPTITSVPTKTNVTPVKKNPTVTGKILSGMITLPGIGEVSSNDGEISASADKILGIKTQQKSKNFSHQIAIRLLITVAIICFITGIYYSIRIVKRKEQTENPL